MTPGKRRSWKTWAGIGAGVLAGLALIGTLAPPEENAQARAAPLDIRDCLNVSDDVVRSLLAGVPGGSLENFWAVRSGEHQNAYYLAGMLTIPGELDGTPALWATNDLQRPGSIYAVNGIAVQFSQWGDGARTAAEFSPADPDARKALACVGD